MSRYKFLGDYRLRLLFQQAMRERVIKRMKAEKLDYVIAIPISSERLAQRGFNQVAPFIPIQVPSCRPLRLKKQPKRDQSSKSRKERMESSQPFELEPDALKVVKGKRLLIIDDVYTTGRTLHHASALLLEAGAVHVVSQSLAR
ncbi:ComF family protein [Fructobacillus sp. M1-13]|uniref:ComF family protein n=1 Tax=Fructobacillus papyriferae TaxID=2713171 RepID=A0ABS5QT89_9LACO|nr:phosphoribosyltransferase family protein [Fructobacillus papyriferae]MBS9335611.1 ComF family protein [Fructobacillus papyriferae]MCD2159300.1 ComF family protein [Fructobacillus papyriferae]